MRNCRHSLSVSSSERLCALLYIVGGAWLYANWMLGVRVVLCPSKLLWHIPCPACGTTRAIVLLLSGEPVEALLMNPNIIITVPLLAVLPLVFCVQHFAAVDVYSIINRWLGHRWVLSAFACFEAAVWIYNIARGI